MTSNFSWGSEMTQKKSDIRREKLDARGGIVKNPRTSFMNDPLVDVWFC